MTFLLFIRLCTSGEWGEGGAKGGDRVGMTGNNCHVHLCLTGSWLPGIFPSTGRVDVTNSHASISLHVQKYELFLYVASYISETRPGWIKVQIFFSFFVPLVYCQEE